MADNISLIETRIANYLESLGYGTVGTDIWYGELPSTPDNAILVTPAPGPEPDRYLDTEYPYLDIWVRNNSTLVARQKIDAIFRSLQHVANVTFGDYYVYFINAVGNPLSRDRDGQNRHLYQLTIQVICHKP